MADSGASDAISSILSPLSGVANLFAVFIAGGAIPLLGWYNKRLQKQKEEKKRLETEHIVTTAKTVTEPIQKEVSAITEYMKKQSEQTEAIIENLEGFKDTVEKIDTNMATLNEKQNNLTIRTQYIDEFFRGNLQLGGTVNKRKVRQNSRTNTVASKNRKHYEDNKDHHNDAADDTQIQK